MTLLPVQTGQVVTVAVFFRATKVLGTGRYAEVYEGLDLQSQSDVALKLYVGTDEQAHAMANAEAQTLSTLNALNAEYFPRVRPALKQRIKNRSHPLIPLELGAYVRPEGSRSVVKVADVLRELPEYSGIIDPTFWQADKLVRWVIHIFQAIRLMEQARIVHRDIKPSNILLKRNASGETLPLIIDFNASSHNATGGRGTPKYLPPEVVSGKRTNALSEDDVWGAALVGWQLLHGDGTTPQTPATTVGSWMDGSVSADVIQVLRDALLLDRECRLVSADEIVNRLEAAIRTSQSATTAPNVLSTEFAEAQSAAPQLRIAIEDALSPPDVLRVPKEIDESVQTLLLWLDEQDTQALDLGREFLALGPRAIPSCLAHGHRLAPDSPAMIELTDALALLGRQDVDVACRSIAAYALSSSMGVRFLCRRLADALEVCPRVLLNALREDSEVLTTAERLDLGRIAMRWCESDKTPGNVLTLMCNEYIRNENRYAQLKRELIPAFSQERFAGTTPELLMWYAARRQWEALEAYQELPAESQGEIARGLVEVLSDAFGVQGEAGWALLRQNKVPRFIPGEPPLALLSKFARKLAERCPPAREWLLAESSRYPDDVDLRRASEPFRQRKLMRTEDIRKAFDEFAATGDRAAFNQLRFSSGQIVCPLITAALSQHPQKDMIARMAELLAGFQSRHRREVVKCALQHWAVLKDADERRGIDIVSRFGIEDDVLKQRAVSALEELLGGRSDSAARAGLDRLLG